MQHDQPERQSVLTESEHESGFITSLYSLCAQQLAEWKKALEIGRTEQKALKHLQPRLFLFGDSFEHGKLESCLSADDELHQIVVSLLFEIGKILSKSKPCRLRGPLLGLQSHCSQPASTVKGHHELTLCPMIQK